MKKQIYVFSFGENENDKWYAKQDGIRIKCDEYIIDKLWWQWVKSPTADRADDENYKIFKVTDQPLYI